MDYKITKELRNQILRCWQNGWQVTNIMAVCCCNKEAVRQALRSKGITLKDGDEGMRQSIDDLKD
jgi:hypothetical protein